MHSKRTINTHIDPRGHGQTAARSVRTLMLRLQGSQRPMAMGILKMGTLYVGERM